MYINTIQNPKIIPPLSYLITIGLWFTFLLTLNACSRNGYTYIQNSHDLNQYINTLPSPQPTTEKNIPNNAKSQSSRSSIVTKVICDNFEHYAPDSLHPEHTPIKWVRVNAHIINSRDSTKNFKEKEARLFIKKAIETANAKLSNNQKMNLPIGNNTPVLPIRFQWLLEGGKDKPNDDGIYFHYDDTLFWVNKKGPNSFHRRDICEKYSIGQDSIINIFFVEHHPDSCKSPTYKASEDGIGYTNCVKIIGSYHSYQKKDVDEANLLDYKTTSIANLINHELGHSLGLSHTWIGSDGCDDTPTNNNCWGYNDDSKCQTDVSNNIMDYNAYRTALTPCQIAKVHYNLSKEKKRQRQYIKTTWCEYNPNETIHIQKGDTIIWNTIKELNSDIIIEVGAQLTIKCTLSMPPNSQILVQKGGTLVLDGCNLSQNCAKQYPWKGIVLQKSSRKKQKAMLKVYNNATLNTFKN